jgi:hypothetical protein
MLRLVSDADFNQDVLRGIGQANSEVDLIRVADVGLLRAHDPLILAWAANHARIVITHDRNTMTGYAYDRVRAGLPMSGVFVIRNKPPLRIMIEEILLVAGASSQEEWINQVVFLPL